MNNYIILNKRKNKKSVYSIIENTHMKKSFKNKRTTIWESDDIQISIDRTLIRVLVYNDMDIQTYKKIFKNR